MQVQCTMCTIVNTCAHKTCTHKKINTHRAIWLYKMQFCCFWCYNSTHLFKKEILLSFTYVYMCLKGYAALVKVSAWLEEDIRQHRAGISSMALLLNT